MIEKEIVIFFNKPQSKCLDLISEMVSDIRFLILFWMIAIICAMNIDFKLGVSIIFELIAVFILHFVFSEMIMKKGAKKFSIMRKRPYIAYPNEVRAIGKNFSDSSFPSSHVSSVVGGLVILYAAFPSFFPVLTFFALLLAFSRLRNGMHYPTDILAGIMLGLIYGHSVLLLM